MNDPNNSSGPRPQTFVHEPRASRGAGSWKFGLLTEPVMIAGIVEWPRIYIIDICKVYLSQQGAMQHSDSNL
jgi:hypothetical protein